MSVLGKVLRKVGGAVDVVRAIRRGSERVDRLEVYGRREFRAAVRGALLLLRDRELPAWETFRQHVGSILEGRRTFVVVTAHPCFMFVDGSHTNQEPEFLAATLAHMARGCELHRTCEAKFPGRRVPREVYAGSAAQESCDRAYRECLLALGKSAERPGSQEA